MKIQGDESMVSKKTLACFVAVCLCCLWITPGIATNSGNSVHATMIVPAGASSYLTTSTVGVYRSTNSAFYLKNTNSAGAADNMFTYGWASSTGDLVPLVSDWTGQINSTAGALIDTVGLYQESTGIFYLKNSNTGGAADNMFTYGWASSTGDLVPLVGDWTGQINSTTGAPIDTIGLYQKSTGAFYLKNTNAAGNADNMFTYGWASSTGDLVPLVGDWTGQITSTTGVPVASFTSNLTSGPKPLSVQFNDTSTNNPTAWNWSFGDGGFSTSQNVTHTYTSTGSYTVALNVTNAAGSNTSSKAAYITVTAAIVAPVASFTSNITSGTVPLTVQFTDTSTNSPTSWNWSFGDSSYSTIQNPAHTYSSTGSYSVSLNATNAAGSNILVKTNYVSVSATGRTFSTGPIGVFSQNYTTLGRVPSNIITVNPLPPFVTPVTPYYSNGAVVTTWSATNNTGYTLIGGFTPETNTRYNITMGHVITQDSDQLNIQIGGLYVVVNPMADGDLRVYNLQGFANGTQNFVYMTIPSGSWTMPYTLTLDYDGINQTETSMIGSYTLTSPMFNTGKLPYEQISPDYMELSLSDIGSGETGFSIKLYNITQTVKRTGNETAIGDKSLQPFGFDGPLAYTTVQNGTALITKAGGRATIWADTGNLVEPAQNIPFVQGLLNEGWELGIHYNQTLSTDTEPHMNTSIIQQTATISSYFTGKPTPTSWCSLQNSDNITDANIVYQLYPGTIWRNGYMGTDGIPTVGNLDDDSWNATSAMSAAGIIIPSFTHETDVSPAIEYSIDYSYFQTWVANLQANGITISPLTDWYKAGANSHDASFTENTFGSALLNFTAHTNGYPALVEVSLPYTSSYSIRDSTGSSVSFRSAPDGNTEFYVTNGYTYTITSG